MIEGPRWGWGAATTIGCGVAGMLALGLFLLAQARGRAPMVPLGLFRSPPFSASMVVAALMTFGIYAMLFLLPIYLQAVRGIGVLWAGLAMLPMALAFVVVSRRSGALASEWGARAVMAAGMACMAGGLLGLALVGRATPFWAVELFALVVGAGLGLNGGPVMAVAVASAPAERSGTASGLGNTARMVGRRSASRCSARCSPRTPGRVRRTCPACSRVSAPRCSGVRRALSPAVWCPRP